MINVVTVDKRKATIWLTVAALLTLGVLAAHVPSSERAEGPIEYWDIPQEAHFEEAKRPPAGSAPSDPETRFPSNGPGVRPAPPPGPEPEPAPVARPVPSAGSDAGADVTVSVGAAAHIGPFAVSAGAGISIGASMEF